MLALGLLIVIACRSASEAKRQERKVQQGDADNKNSVTSGGVNDGNTGELTTTKNNPWFVGVTPARYCVQFGEDTFAAKNDKAKLVIIDQVEAAFAQWVEFLQLIYPLSPGLTPIPNPKSKFLAGPAVANLTRSFQRVDCTNLPDMRIKVGTWERADADFLKYTSRYTVGYALRTAYSEETGRSQGFIWLVPDSGPRRYKGPAPDGAFWSDGRYLQNVVLHELGHIFGVEHLESTFMDAKFPAGALASGLKVPWTFDDLKVISGKFFEQCGSYLHHKGDKDDPESVVPQEVFGVKPETVQQVCWRPAEDRRRSDDRNTPTLVWLKGVGDKTLGEQLMYHDGLFGQTKRISGNYLKKVDGSDYRYSTVDQAIYVSPNLDRLHFDRGGRSHWVEIEISPPGIAIFRFAYQGAWKQIVTWLINPDKYKSLDGALKAASFENDGDPDD